MAPFDPYHNWLGIPPHEQPVNFYRLLGLVLFESNREVIAQAADRQSLHISNFQGGPTGQYCEPLLYEISQARACLLDAQQKAGYDNYLQETLGAKGERTVVAAPPPPATMGFAGGMGHPSPGNPGAGMPSAFLPQAASSGALSNGGAWSNGGPNGPSSPPGGFASVGGEMPMQPFVIPPPTSVLPSTGGLPAYGVPANQPGGFAPGSAGIGQPLGQPQGQSSNPNFLSGAGFFPGPGAGQPTAQQPVGPQARMPAPVPITPRPFPIAQPTNARIVAVGSVAQAVTPPLPPAEAPPRPVDEIQKLSTTIVRRRFSRSKRNRVPVELIGGGLLLGAAALAFIIWQVSNADNPAQQGNGRVVSPATTNYTTAAAEAEKDIKKALAARDSSKAGAGDKSRPVISVKDPAKQARHPADPNDHSNRQPVDGGDEVTAPYQFGPPSRILESGQPAGQATDRPGDSDDTVIRDVIGGDGK